jgi:hypothetical protein
MSQIKKNRIKTRLILQLKKKWFDMIKSGVKKEEYRELKPFWIRRLILPLSAYGRISNESMFKKFDEVVFTLGYPRENDKERRIVFKNPKIKIGLGKENWGAEPHKMYFVITWDK